MTTGIHVQHLDRASDYRDVLRNCDLCTSVSTTAIGNLRRILTMWAAFDPPSPQARAAVRAVKEGSQWGPLMTLKYLVKRGAVNHANVALKFEERRRNART